ncbi:hypothetical protein AJ79_03154 [Helicocarpus griseus UAMH5409]|uniref:Uncharacterized protein n=1 Tax=Helicocarpus griseus UAMH5409 TaxID=1447875 RepID=A0A2B7Y0D7_9EURO|nr:hypothetical protein AJ79_03154 [Helicocarpus griseus UAMH5409]
MTTIIPTTAGNGRTLRLCVRPLQVVLQTVRDCETGRIPRYLHLDTHRHTYDEIANRIPEDPDKEHKWPSLNASRYSHWLPSLMTDPSNLEWHLFKLKKDIIGEIKEAYRHWEYVHELNEQHVIRVMELFPRSALGLSLHDFFNRGIGWFCRLDLASPTDGIDGDLPITSQRELVKRLCTSGKTMDALCIDRKKTKLFLVPFDHEMSSSFEFRAFCPPLSGHVAAISQRRWLDPYPTAPLTS